jgi:hypothetical protein
VLVTPVPIAVLLGAADASVYDIGAMPFHQIAAVSAIFTIVPNVIVAVIAVVDPNLDYGLSLQTGSRRKKDWHGERRR